MTESFLGNSATFLGCIFTLVVLGILFNESNYILGVLKLILSESKEEVKREIIKHKKKLNKARKKARLIEEQLISNSGNVSPENLKLINEQQTLSTLSLNAVYRGKYLEEQIKRLTQMDEFASSFMYTFLFCLVVFIADELYVDSQEITTGHYCLNTVYVFSLITIYIWLLKWVYFWYHIDKRIKDSVKKYHFTTITSLGLILGVPAFSIGLCILLGNQYPTIVDYDFYIYFFLIITAIVGLVAIKVFWNNEFRFTISFVMAHFICILLSVIFLLWRISVDLPVTELVSSVWVRRVSLFAALLTGIILPFLVPLCKFYYSIFIIRYENNKDIDIFNNQDKPLIKSLFFHVLTNKKGVINVNGKQNVSERIKTDCDSLTEELVN